MSPVVGNFVHDLVEMAKAMDALPGVEAECARLQEQHLADGKHVAELELRIIEMKATQDELNAKLRSVEAERDDAGFRHLEAEDRVAATLRTLRSIETSVRQTIAAVEGDGKDQAVPMSVAELDEWLNFKIAKRQQAEEEAARAAQAEAEQAAKQAHEAWPTAQPVEVVASPLPTPVPEQAIGSGTESGSSSIDVADPEPVEAPSVGPYVGLRYYDHPRYVSLGDWLDGGGTPEDYNWQPERANAC